MVTISDIRAAADRIRGQAVKTPFLCSAALDKRAGASLFFKAENLQIGGSFKFRGAYNLLLQLTDAERERGGVATSSGNHAQGFAAAARLLGMKATIAMPFDAPPFKIENTKAFGADVVYYDRYKDDEKLVRKGLAAESGAVEVPPFDHPHIIAGQGTAALEFLEQIGQGAALDALIVPCGGGGLSAGCALVLQALSPSTRIYIVEPEGFDDTSRALSTGDMTPNSPDARSICDALLLPVPGRLTFPVLKEAGATGLTVSEDEVRLAVRTAFETLKMVVEPGGAVGLAALLCGRYDFTGQKVGVILSGGNIAPDLMADILS